MKKRDNNISRIQNNIGINKDVEKLPDGALNNTLKRTPAAEPGIATPCKIVYDFSGNTVLAVDDVEFNLTMIGMFFKNTGAKMLFAANGREALDACISEPNVDIVLMDIQMPVMNGLDATREIKKLNPEIPVIAITAYVHAEDRLRCFEAGCDDFLLKPCSRADMLLMVNKYIRVPLKGPVDEMVK